ncbi:hypothetical protein [Amaricoccus solimangrovi]|uniref:Uncharacterized protein n=1 Tax=Amaricoccus solimangrovi TaxID=2589815 RepID=A0A501WJ13_9RHOB|nr:hypothetical protein [Amaricoccus solimangrovi]TPE49883.1 hypothetical protein FJM51_13030 [Amaricoccus solimangrovi]
MIDIVSKRSGPRPEDERARKVIEANRPVIDKLADHLTNGAWSARRNAPAKTGPEPEGLIIHTARATARSEPPRPFVRIAVNGRVSLVDLDTGRQMHHLGDIRRRDGITSFRLATRENGFFSPVEPEIAEAIADLDGQALEGPEAERGLTEAIGARLRL